MILRLILGDQLNYNHSWYKDVNNNVIYCLMEIRQETDYVKHHIQKILAFFGSMRNFATHLKNQGHQVIYLKLDNKDNQQDLCENLKKIIAKKQVTQFEYQEPDEYRLNEQLVKFTQTLEIKCVCCNSEHFLSSRNDLKEFFAGKKNFLMESFYRHMRKKYDILMDGKEPITGQWNYDKDNRKKFPLDYKVPKPITFENDVSEIKALVDKTEINYFGNVNEHKLIWPLSRDQALEYLDYFCSELLPEFGNYQDALHPEEWSMFHSRLSFALNVKMLGPLEVIQRVEKEFHDGRRNIDIATTEGFIRQILGWREYMRGIYWAKMPDFAQLNFFNHKRKLPGWFWTGDTKMDCMRHAIQQSLDYAYAHHIQRLMITGNFALLAGIDPDDIDQWYLGIYIDAIEWVEITNTRGMSQFADGGIVGTKPYVSSANYIDKMGHYCKDCHYSKSKKTGDKACPFNSLYWHFYARNEDKLKNNPRIGMMYRTWDRMDNDKQKEYLDQAEKYMEDIESL